MGRSQPFDLSATITLDASGNGTARLGPSRVKEHWQPAAVYVSVVSNNAEAAASLYVGATATPDQTFAQTGTGSSGDTCAMGGIDIQSGTFIIVQWKGGDPGALATMRVLGTYSIGAPGLI